MLWSRETRMSDTSSSYTLTEFRAEPRELTDRLYAMSEPLALKIVADFARDARLIPAPPPILSGTAPAGTYSNGAAMTSSTTTTSVAPSSGTAVAQPATPPTYTQPTYTPPGAWTPAAPVDERPKQPQSGFPSH